jgi:hypothetical protein
VQLLTSNVDCLLIRSPCLINNLTGLWGELLHLQPIRVAIEHHLDEVDTSLSCFLSGSAPAVSVQPLVLDVVGVVGGVVFEVVLLVV